MFAGTVWLGAALASAQSPAGETKAPGTAWEKQKVHGKDQTLRDIENRAKTNSNTVISDVRGVINDDEVDLYRLVLRIGKRYGMETAYALESEGVAEKRTRWADQALPGLKLSGTEVEKGLALYRAYLDAPDEDFKIVEMTKDKVIFKRKDFVNAIYYACTTLNLDPITVNNKVYAGPTTLMLVKINPGLKHSFLKYDGDGWYEEMIELTQPK